MAEFKLRLNLSAEEVELLVDDKVVMSSGSDVFTNWVAAYNDKHKVVHTEPVALDEPVKAEPVKVDGPVEETVVTETVQTVDNDKEE